MPRKSTYFVRNLLLCVLCLPLFIKGQFPYLPTIFWDPRAPALDPQHWSKVVNVKLYQSLTFLCPNNIANMVPFNLNAKSYYNLYVREILPNDTDLDYDTICDPKQSSYVFSCNGTLSESKRLQINTQQAHSESDPDFNYGKHYIFFSTSNGRKESLVTSSTKCTMVFRIHFCAESDESCATPQCSTFGREEVCVPRSSLSDAPREVNVTANTTSSLSISWKQPLNPDNDVAYYTVCYRTNTSQDCQTKLVEGHIRSAILENLNSSTEYFIRVRAVTCKGPGNYSEEISYKTQEIPPTTTEPTPSVTTLSTSRLTPTLKDEATISKPKKLSSSSITSSSVKVSWQAPDVIVGDMIYYSLCARVEHDGGLEKDCEERMITEPAELSAVVNGLTANTSYGIRVRAHNIKRPGNYSEELIIKTNGNVSADPPDFQAQSSCSESTIDSVSLVVGIVIGAVAALAVSALVYIFKTKRETIHKPPQLKNITNRGFRSSVSGTNTLDKSILTSVNEVNTLDKKNDRNLNCTMELDSVA